MAALDPKVWLVFIVAVLLAFGSGYIKGRADGKKLEQVAVQGAVIEEQKRAQKIQDELMGKARGLNQQLIANQKDSDDKIQDLATQVRDGKLHPSIRVKLISVPVATGTASTSVSSPTPGNLITETRAELSESTFSDLMRIAGLGDKAILQSNACIDAYNQVVEASKGQ